MCALFGVDPHKQEDDVTEEEIISMVDDAHEQGVIEENEAEMIQNIMEFSETEAQDIMTHRKESSCHRRKHLIKGCFVLYAGQQQFPLSGIQGRY